MAQVINTNSISLTAQNNLNRSQSALGTAIERLSSSLRINSAKDDAAGQAISNRFTANINGLAQASMNANNGISIAQTTEGALNEVIDNLQNIRRLTVAAKNGTNSESDRVSIQDEITQRLAEIDRISEQTEFNGVKVLSANQTLTIQVGANDNETIEIQLNKMDADQLGMTGFSVVDGFDPASGTETAIKDQDKLPIFGTPTLENDATGAEDKPIDGNIYKDDQGKHFVKGTDNKFYALTQDTTDKTKYTYDTKTAVGTDPTGTTVVTEVHIGDTTVSNDTGKDLIKFTATDGGKESYLLKDAAGVYYEATMDATGKVTEGKALTVGGKTTADPLKLIDAALSQVDGLRSGLGAVQNRFTSVINNLNSTVINLSASRSRILDADFATEVSNMSRGQILQQAGTAVLSQANNIPQNVTQLLRG
ncbi:FliC/FljB family flagellin [Biostraticola tofi]|uniref:Flagellin n=1 Tax=Biostraticola tofi TaxID=466109 RepID=A0A4R3YRR5_9GAMM|nr:FliC/FljB family flagellin [Biostraticola tofi]TCV95567.1 flagellin [Biostraticola tofi]